MTLQEKLKWFGQALDTLEGVTVRHFTRGAAKPPFAVWQEEGEGDSFYVNNAKAELRIAGGLDYFTQTEFDPTVDEIQRLLQRNCVEWTLESVQHEEETKLIHYRWTWELGYGKL